MKPKTSKARRVAAVLLAASSLSASTACVAGSGGPAGVARSKTVAAKPGPFVTLLFSRTEITAAVNCVPSDAGVVRLDSGVAPYLASLGLSATGTLVTGNIRENGLVCTHSNASLMGSWADASALASRYGWHFVSHTATYPANIGALAPARIEAETCGSAHTIDAHGLPGGHGLIAYPGSHHAPTQVQADYSAKCFAWGRMYNPRGTTLLAAGTTPPYWQQTTAPGGGACNDPAAACYTAGSGRYVLPEATIANVNALAPGKWMTIQVFILVTDTNPPGSAIQWDCSSPDPREHWTNDNERYCADDWKQVVQAIHARSDITVTDPLTVGVAFGRPATY